MHSYIFTHSRTHAHSFLLLLLLQFSLPFRGICSASNAESFRLSMQSQRWRYAVPCPAPLQARQATDPRTQGLYATAPVSLCSRVIPYPPKCTKRETTRPRPRPRPRRRCPSSREPHQTESLRFTCSALRHPSTSSSHFPLQGVCVCERVGTLLQSRCWIFECHLRREERR